MCVIFICLAVTIILKKHKILPIKTRELSTLEAVTIKNVLIEYLSANTQKY